MSALEHHVHRWVDALRLANDLAQATGRRQRVYRCPYGYDCWSVGRGRRLQQPRKARQ